MFLQNIIEDDEITLYKGKKCQTVKFQLMNVNNEYSPFQDERHHNTMKQLRKIWKKVIKELNFCRSYGMPIEQMNRIMTVGLYKLYFAEYRYYINNHPEFSEEFKRKKSFKILRLKRLRNNISEL